MSNAIDIRIGGESLDLSPDTSISFELISPLFSDEYAASSHSYQFSFPNTARNQRLLQRAEAVLVSGRTRVISCEIFLFQVRWKTGNINVQKAKQGRYQTSIVIEGGRLAQAWRDKLLTSYDFGGERVISSDPNEIVNSAAMVAHANTVAASDIDNYDYTFFPIKNLQAPEGYINYYRDDTFWDTDSWNTSFAQTKNWQMVAFPYALYVLKSVLEEEGFRLMDSDFAIHSLIKTLTVYSNRSINLKANRVSGSFAVANQLPPDVKTLEWVRGFLRLFRAILVVDSQEVRLIAATDLVSSTDQVDWTQKGLDYEVGFMDNRGFTFSSVQDETDNHLSSLSNPEPEFTVQGTSFTVDQLPSTADNGAIYYVKFEVAYYQYNEETPGWEFFSYSAFPVKHGEGANSWASNQSTTMATLEDWHSSQEWRIPYVDQLLAGFKTGGGISNERISPRLIIYTGIQELNSGEDTYPKGEVNGVEGNYSLLWEGTEGLFEIWHKPWIEMVEAGVPLTYDLLLTPLDLMRLDWTKRVRVRVREGYARAWIKKIRLTIGLDGIRSTKAEMIADGAT